MTHALSVSVQNVAKCFGDHTVLDNVNMQIDAGRTVAIVGPSGGGKSTLLRCINGLSHFDGGQIVVGPYVLEPDSAHQSANGVGRVRRLLGMIFQDFQLFPHMTALENVMEAPTHVLRMSKADAKQKSLDLLARVGLANRAHAYPRELSGGQKQRVAIARAMAMEPRGLLCDEITSALDPELKCEVLAVLEDLRKEGLTLIVVTHEIGFARRAADHVVVLADGRIIEEGPPGEVLEKPQTARTQRFLSQVLA